MKTRMKRDARLLALLALLAVLPLGMLGCDAGDSPGAPTGPAAQYNPDIDYPGATITAVANRSSVAPGDDFDIIATLKDANGTPVEGVPLLISAEMGGAASYFDYETRPTLTDGSGKASIGVIVSAGCPAGSYRFMIYPLRGPTARGYVGVTVGDAGGAAIVTGVTLSGTPSTTTVGNSVTFTATVTATAGCSVRYMYNAAGAGLNTGWSTDGAGASNLFTQTPSATGTLSFLVRAYCEGTPAVYVESNQVNITVNAVAASGTDGAPSVK